MTKKAKGSVFLGGSREREGSNIQILPPTERSVAFPGEDQSLVPTVPLGGPLATESTTNMTLQSAKGGLVYDGNGLPTIAAPTIPGITDDLTDGGLDALQKKERRDKDLRQPVSLTPKLEDTKTIGPTTPSVIPLQEAATFDVNGTLNVKEQALRARQESRRRRPDRRPPRH